MEIRVQYIRNERFKVKLNRLYTDRPDKTKTSSYRIDDDRNDIKVYPLQTLPGQSIF
ncbi:hypothetical protein BA6E_11416 [Bacteroidales bacterium 6E]|nr:hypothetical protein BA6E_11416 [Bacteroidales bacterium 6E]